MKQKHVIVFSVSFALIIPTSHCLMSSASNNVFTSLSCVTKIHLNSSNKNPHSCYSGCLTLQVLHRFSISLLLYFETAQQKNSITAMQQELFALKSIGWHSGVYFRWQRTLYYHILRLTRNYYYNFMQKINSA